ncbi:hypothetical protein C0Q70_20090 [Pomacea canaliculata]|uniref:Uncharacterized protein n=1 Tax=Pomacea canaliculata TaxID=400727 RepID=A0A2T7NEL1_POMCA|nr:hypothetical protein C0Q70_20090 [Pomacea canaliculata]
MSLYLLWLLSSSGGERNSQIVFGRVSGHAPLPSSPPKAIRLNRYTNEGLRKNLKTRKKTRRPPGLKRGSCSSFLVSKHVASRLPSQSHPGSPKLYPGSRQPAVLKAQYLREISIHAANGKIMSRYWFLGDGWRVINQQPSEAYKCLRHSDMDSAMMLSSACSWEGGTF